MSQDRSDDAPKPMDAPPPLADPGRYDGPSRAAPYALTRTTPAYSLVDVAAEVERADALLATVTGGKLTVIAEQIRHLQEKARGLLERARRDAELHRARCNFEKKPGGVYHLYRRASGERWFSLLAPEEWSSPPAHQTFEGTYRLETDMGFTRLDVREEDA